VKHLRPLPCKHNSVGKVETVCHSSTYITSWKPWSCQIVQLVIPELGHAPNPQANNVVCTPGEELSMSAMALWHFDGAISTS